MAPSTSRRCSAWRAGAKTQLRSVTRRRPRDGLTVLLRAPGVRMPIYRRQVPVEGVVPVSACRRVWLYGRAGRDGIGPPSARKPEWLLLMNLRVLLASILRATGSRRLELAL